VLSSTYQKNMNAAVFLGPNKIANRQVRLEKNAKENALLLRVKACAVCGYDVRVFRNGHEKVTPPIILGHEICAETTEDLKLADGEMVTAGTRVAISPLIPCLHCIYCTRHQFNLCNGLREIGSSIDGGFAEYIQIPDTTLQVGGIVPVPNGMRDEEVSLLEPLSCCINGLSRLENLKREEVGSVCIIGDGPIGLIHLQLFKLIGAKTIVIGKVESRIKMARSMGADAVLFANDNNLESTVNDITSVTEHEGANVVIVAASNPSALTLATRIVSKNSEISLFAGMPKGTSFSLDANWLHYNQISLIGNFSATPDSIKNAISLVAENRIDLSAVISHRYSLFNIEDALAATENYRGLRTVINKF
jgi:L-iditol 2-dehydrogenase